MTTRILLSVALGGNLPAHEPGDPDYVPDPQVVDEYERLGEEEDSDYALNGGAYHEAADQAAAIALAVVPPSSAEVEEFRAGLETHWGGNLPALWAYLDSIDPGGGDNPAPPGKAAPYWEPDDDYDEFGNVIETAEEEREWWRARVEQKLRQLSQSY